MQTPLGSPAPRTLTLPPRLLAVAGQVLGGVAMADVGTDHGLLPLHLLVTGRVPRAVALDLRPRPLAVARQHAERLGLGEAQGFLAKVSDGLAALSPGGLGTVTLAGLGGSRITAILGRSAAHLAQPGGVSRIVASPNLEADVVRAWAQGAGWGLVHEGIVEERGRFYPVLVMEPGAVASGPMSEADLRFGPLLRRRRPAPFLRWLASERARLQVALALAERGVERADLAPLRSEIALVESELTLSQ